MPHIRHASEFVDARLFESAVADCARAVPPNPKRLRLACLLVYSGLVLTLAAPDKAVCSCPPTTTWRRT